jgi:hypothetical protein
MSTTRQVVARTGALADAVTRIDGTARLTETRIYRAGNFA